MHEAYRCINTVPIPVLFIVNRLKGQTIYLIRCLNWNMYCAPIYRYASCDTGKKIILRIIFQARSRNDILNIIARITCSTVRLTNRH